MKRKGGTVTVTTVPTLAQPAVEAHTMYAAPWRERLPDGSWSEPYGPPSPSAQAARTARLRDWSYSAETARQVHDQRCAREARRALALLEWLEGHEATLPDSERLVARLVVREGHAVRWVARKLGMRRETVKSYLERVRRKAGLDKPESAPAE